MLEGGHRSVGNNQPANLYSSPSQPKVPGIVLKLKLMPLSEKKQENELIIDCVL